MLNETRPTILCVDDTPLILDVLSDILKSEYNVKTTVDYKEALKMCSEHEIEVVIVGRNMPEIDGIEFLVKVNKLNPICKKVLITDYGETDAVVNAIKLRKVFITGYAKTEAVLNALKLGVIDEFVSKPFDFDKTKKTVEDLLENYSYDKYKIYTKVFDNSAANNQPILVVDDDPFSLEILYMIFMDKYHVYTATDADSALEIMNNCQIRLVISDYTMPDISGLELLEMITKKYQNVGRILITAQYDMSEVLEDALNKNIVDKLVHKSNKTQLIGFVHDILSRQGESKEYS
ncbi:MAG: response regulator [Candidatus Anammoxibacter sp.]